MRMQKGLCIEMNGESSIFLGQDGEFVQGKPAGEIAVGEQGYYYPKQAMGAKKKWSVKPVWAPVFAAMAVAALFLTVLLPEPEAFAYVQVQVNPGVELGIDEEYNVISIRNLNEDGRELIKELGEWKHQSLEKVLDDVINLSMAESTKEITITTVADEEDQITDEEVTESVLAISAKAMEENVTVKLKEATKKQWRTSIEERVPVGQLIERSKKVETEEEKEKINKDSKQPVNVEEKPDKKNQGSGDEVQEKIEKEPKPKENKSEDEKVSDTKEKPEPPGQEKRKETPASDKGKQNPPGQEKRNQVPGQDKKEQPSDSKKPSSDKGKETAPGQQKKQEDKGNKNSSKAKDKEKGNSSEGKEKKENKGPSDSGKKNSNGKQNGNN